MINLITDEQIEIEFERELNRLEYWVKYNHNPDPNSELYMLGSICSVLEYLRNLDSNLKSKLLDSTLCLTYDIRSKSVGVQIFVRPNKSRQYKIDILEIDNCLQFRSGFSNCTIQTQAEFEQLVCEQF